MVGFFLPSLPICSPGSTVGDAGSRAGIAGESFAAISAPVPGPDSPVFNLNLPSVPLQLVCAPLQQSTIAWGIVEGWTAKRSDFLPSKDLQISSGGETWAP